MNTKGYIILTGAAGFIGSCMTAQLNELGYTNLILVDDFGIEKKRKNWESKQYSHIVERYNLFDWLADHNPAIDFVIHFGARTDTTEFNYAIHQELNVDYSKAVWNYCITKQVPVIYASSAATYGAGELGYDDNHELPFKLQPLNPYGISKNEFDKWALLESTAPPFWAGLKFFNVYGPNEYHKGRMASVIWHAFNQLKKDGFVKLFKSHRADFSDGEQLRDFIYVKDLVSVVAWMVSEKYPFDKNAKLANGLYNLGTGKARSFYDLAANTFTAQGLEPDIRFIDMPEDIRDKYQYFTEANMHKIFNAGYNKSFYSLESGIRDYVQNYLVLDTYL
ncbi:MAG: ADP-glyceromanno-heptose 6-epimerase [Bacteroidota bacterium]